MNIEDELYILNISFIEHKISVRNFKLIEETMKIRRNDYL